MKTLLSAFAMVLLAGLAPLSAQRASRLATQTAPATAPPLIWKSSTRALTSASVVEVRFPSEMIVEAEVGTEINAATGGPLTVTPPLAGRWTWRSTTSGVFAPADEPQRGQEYTFALRGGLNDLRGQAVAAEPRRFAQRAAGLLLTHRHPMWFSYSNAPRQPELLLQFNDKINAASAAKALHFQDKAGVIVKAKARAATVADLPAGYAIPPSFRQQALGVAGLDTGKTAPTATQALAGTLIVTPAEPLPVGDEWHLIVAGVASADGKAKLEDADSVKIGDVTPLHIRYHSANNELGEPKNITLYFNKELAEGATAEDVTSRVSLQPAPADSKIVYEEGVISITGDFAHETEYNVTLAGGLKSADGLLMAEAFRETFTFHMIEPVIALPAFSASQLAKGRAVFDVHAVNLASATVKVKAADRESLIYALRAYQSYFGSDESEEAADDEDSGGGFTRIPFDTMPGQKIYEHTFASTAGIDRQDAFVVDWKQALNGKAAGALFVTVEGEAREEWTGKKKRFGAQAFVQLTDLGLAWKLTPQEAFVYVFSQATGQPLPGVALTAFDEEKRTLATAKTAADGTARLSRQDAAWLMAESADDLHVVVMESDEVETLGMWRFGVSYDWDPPRGASRAVEVFTERPIYLPGHTVYFKAVSRVLDEKGVKKPAGGEKATLRAYDSRGRLFHEREVQLSANGTCDGALELPVGSLGHHRLELHFAPLAKDASATRQGGQNEAADADADDDEDSRSRDTFAAYFLVEEYKPNTFQITFDDAAFKLDGEKAQASLQARYLLGKPLSKAALAWTAEVSRGGFETEAFSDYSFLDSRQTYYWDEEGYHDVPGEEGEDIVTAQAKTNLSDQGQASMDFAVPAAPFQKAPRAIHVTAEVTDINQQTITERWSKTLHSSDFYLGIKDLDSVSGEGSLVAIDLAAARADGEPWPQPVDARVTVEKVHFINVRVQTVGGGSNVKTEAQRAVVAEGAVTVRPKGQNTEAFAWTPKEPGFYYVTARAADPQGRAVESVTSLQVYGESWATWEERDGVKIDLAADKTRYTSGETAKVLVKSPITGRALVTLERRGVMKHFFTDITSNAQAIDIPIDDTLAPNVYVSVFVLRGSEASPKQHKAPEYKVGFCELTVTDSRSRLAVSAAAAQPSYRPGDEGFATAKVTDASGAPVAGAEVTFWAADDGVLTLREYSAPDLWSEFHQPQPLAVLTGTSLISLLPENPKELQFTNKGYVIGGGGMELMGEKLRKNFQPVAFFHGALTTDAKGEVSAKFTVPDNLTRFRLVAVAVAGDDRFGSVEGAFEVNKPLMIEPALPRFANVGDKITVKGIVMNNTDQAFDAEVALALDGLATTEQETTRTISVAARETKAVAFPLTFNEPGTATWKWSVRATKPGVTLADAMESSLEVGFAQPILRDLQYTAITPETAGQDVLAALNPELLEGRGEITLTVSNSTLSELSGALAYLLHYPYGCVEQTTSSTLPWLALSQLGGELQGLKHTPEQAKKAIQKGAARLLSMQTQQGGLGYWPGAAQPELWASTYGGMALALCREAGAVVPQERLDQIAAYLSGQLRNTASLTDSYDLYHRAFACYTLALLGKAEPAYHEALAQKINRLPHPARGLLALAILTSGGSHDQAVKVLDDPLDPDLQKWTGNLFESRLTAINLLVWLRLDAKSPVTLALTERLLKERTPHGHWGSTYENAWAVLALAEESRANAASLAAQTLTVSFDGKEQPLALPAKPATRTLTLPFSAEARQKGLAVKGATGRLRASIEVAARPKLTPTQPRAEGLSISRKYEKLSPDGHLIPADSLEVGDLVAVTLDMEIPARTRYVAVDDALPAIFEAINPKFKSQSQTAAAKPGTDHTTANWWWSSHEELRTDRALFFADEIWRGGPYQIRYLARVVAEGLATAPPAKIEAMYSPEKYGLSGTQVIGARAGSEKIAAK